MTHAFVVCAYQNSPYLEQCLRSLLAQTIPSDVYLATSTPSFYIRRLAEKYRVPVCEREGASGLRDDWRFALSVGAASHSLVTIAHQDDVYRRDYAEKLLTAAARDRDMTVFSSDYVVLKTREERAADGSFYPAETRLVQADRARLIKKLLRLPLRFPFLADRTAGKESALRFGNAICCPSCTYNVDLTGTDLFRSNDVYALDWDNLLWLARRPGRFVVCEEPLLAYRIHDGAATKQCMRENRRGVEELMMYRKLWPEGISRLLLHFYKKAYEEYED